MDSSSGHMSSYVIFNSLSNNACANYQRVCISCPFKYLSVTAKTDYRVGTPVSGPKLVFIKTRQSYVIPGVS